MIPTLAPSAQAFLNNLNRINSQMERAQREMSTGVRISSVSDSPDQVSALLQARASLAAAQQIGSNLVRTKAETDAGEQALQSAVQLFDRVQTLAAQGDNSAQTAESRAALAQEVGSVLGQIGGLAATRAEGRYIFSGDSDQTQPYTVDLTQAVPVSPYLGSPSTRVSQHANGTTFPVALTAQTIFDSSDPTTNVFASIVTLRDALAANNDTAIHSALGGLQKVATYLNSQLSFYGTTQNRVAEATDFGKTLETQIHTQISDIESADFTQSILDLNQAQTQQQAALQARARIPRTTLFDYL